MATYVNSVVQASITIAAASASNTYSLSTAVGKWFLIWNGQVTSSSTEQSGVAYLTLSGTTVTATRSASASGAVTVYFSAVDGDTSNLVVSVQTGTASITAGNSTGTATITSVTATHSIIHLLGYGSSGAGTQESPVVKFSGTTVTGQLASGLSAGTITVAFEVIEFQAGALNSNTQSKQITYSASPTTSTITSVTANNTMLFWGGTSQTNNIRDWGRVTLTNATTLTVTAPAIIGASNLLYVYVCEFVSAVMASAVQRGTITLTTTSNTATVTGTGANAIVSWLGMSESAASTTWAQLETNLTYSSPTVTSTCNTTPSGFSPITSYQVIDFAAVRAPINGAAVLNCVTTQTAIAQNLHQVSLSLSCVSVFSPATGNTTHNSTVLLQANTIFTTNATCQHNAIFTGTCTCLIVPISQVIHTSASAMKSVCVTSQIGKVNHNGNLSLLCVVKITANAVQIHNSSCNLRSVCLTTNIGRTNHTGNSTLLCVVKLTANAQQTKTGLCSIRCVCLTANTTKVTHNGNSALLCVVKTTTIGRVNHTGNSSLLCVAKLTSISSQIIHTGKSNYLCVAKTTQTNKVTHNGSANLLCVVRLTASVIETKTGLCAIRCVCLNSNIVKVTHNGLASLIYADPWSSGWNNGYGAAPDTTVTASAKVTHNSKISLTCVVTLTATATSSSLINGVAALKCVCLLSANSKVTHNVKSSLLCVCSITAQDKITHLGYLNLLANCSVSNKAQIIHNSTSSLLCVVRLTANSIQTIPASCNLKSVCLLSANSQTIHRSNISLKSVCILTASVIETKAGLCAIRCVCSNSNIVKVTHNGIASLIYADPWSSGWNTGYGAAPDTTVTATAKVTHNSKISFNCVVTLTATASSTNARSGTANLTCVCTVVPKSKVTHNANLNIKSICITSAKSKTIHRGLLSLNCIVVTSTSAKITHRGLLGLNCVAKTTSNPFVTHNNRLTLTCVVILTATAKDTHPARQGHANFTCVCKLTATSQVIHRNRATLTCVITNNNTSQTIHNGLFGNYDPWSSGWSSGFYNFGCGLTASPKITHNAKSTLTCVTKLSISSQVVKTGKSPLTCVTKTTSTSQVIHNGKLLALGPFTIGFGGGFEREAEGGVCTFTATGFVRQRTSAALTCNISVVAHSKVIHTGIVITPEPWSNGWNNGYGTGSDQCIVTATGFVRKIGRSQLVCKVTELSKSKVIHRGLWGSNADAFDLSWSSGFGNIYSGDICTVRATGTILIKSASCNFNCNCTLVAQDQNKHYGKTRIVCNVTSSQLGGSYAWGFANLSLRTIFGSTGRTLKLAQSNIKCIVTFNPNAYLNIPGVVDVIETDRIFDVIETDRVFDIVEDRNLDVLENKRIILVQESERVLIVREVRVLTIVVADNIATIKENRLLDTNEERIFDIEPIDNLDITEDRNLLIEV